LGLRDKTSAATRADSGLAPTHVIRFFEEVGFMRHRFLLAAVLAGFAFVLQGQGQKAAAFKIDLVPSGSMIALDYPTLQNGRYSYHEWPDGQPVTLAQARVRKITQIAGGPPDPVYQILLNPSGMMLAKDKPTLKGSTFVFRTWRDGTLMSVRKSDIFQIRPLTGDEAFWAEQGQLGESSIGTLALEGGATVVEIGTPVRGNSSQAGRTSASSLNSGISGAPVYGNWQYQGTPGVSDAYAPANATMSGGVPTMPAATSGSAPPQ
jgi:hypothetical protein